MEEARNFRVSVELSGWCQKETTKEQLGEFLRLFQSTSQMLAKTLVINHSDGQKVSGLHQDITRNLNQLAQEQRNMNLNCWPIVKPSVESEWTQAMKEFRDDSVSEVQSGK